jgi:hypothetical protein
MIPLLLIRIGSGAAVVSEPGKITADDALTFSVTARDATTSAITADDELVASVTAMDDP